MPNTLNVSALCDHQLLASAKDLARRARRLNMRIIDHLRKTGSRELHLRHGYGSLFDCGQTCSSKRPGARLYSSDPSRWVPRVGQRKQAQTSV